MPEKSAFQLRIAASLLVLLLTAGIVRFVWFPGAYFALFGVGKLLLILLGVNLILGPGLSALVYHRRKPGWRGDLGVLASVELVALALAMSAVYARQPAYAVFAVDRFEVVTRAEIDRSQIAHEELETRPGLEPRLVYAALPEDPEAMNQLIDDTVFLGKADIDRRPEFWKPYAAGVPKLKARAKPISHLLTRNGQRAKRVRRWLSSRPGDAGDYLYLPLRARHGDAAMIVHADIGYPVDVLLIDPW